MNKLVGLSLLFCVGATIVSTISTAIPYWVYRSEGTVIVGTAYAGLWKSCTIVSVPDTTKATKTCTNIDNAPDWLKSVQALMILGILFLALSSLFSGLYCKDDSKKSLLHGAIFTAALGGVALIIAVIVYGVEEKDYSSDFHACFYLAIVSGADAFVAAALMVISKRRAGYSSM